MLKVCTTAQALSRAISYPLKHKPKLRYPVAVTVCIAVSNNNPEPRIILCSDSRLDYGCLGSTNTTVKLDVLGHGWCVQLAGEWSGATHLCSLLKQLVQKKPRAFDSVKELETVARSALKRFVASSFCNPKESYELLLSGFFLAQPAQPALITVTVNKAKGRLDLNDSFCAIGSGGWASTAMLTQRECHPQMPLDYSIYLAYEAKRASEKTGTVGRYTALAVQSPNAIDIKDKATMAIASIEGVRFLESIYSGVWRVPFVDMPNLPEGFYKGLPKRSKQ